MTKADSETVVVAETGLGKYQVEARAGDAAFLIDEPVHAGGLGSGPNPYSLLSAALGSCTAMTIRLYANRKSWPLTRVQVAVRHKRASLEATDLFEADVTLEGALDDAQRARLMEIGERCPVHLTLARGSQVRNVLLPLAEIPKPADSPAHMKCMVEACAD
ncbi:MAG TPA: OsmC family protein [Rhizomicrobium sp.]|nr:OsmC family protein [Rhizomicrobium sp.]